MGKYSQERMPYPSDVTDEEWALLEPLIPAAGACEDARRYCQLGNRAEQYARIAS